VRAAVTTGADAGSVRAPPSAHATPVAGRVSASATSPPAQRRRRTLPRTRARVVARVVARGTADGGPGCAAVRGSIPARYGRDARLAGRRAARPANRPGRLVSGPRGGSRGPGR